MTEYETIMYTWFPNLYCGPYTLYDYDVENGRYQYEIGYEIEHCCELRSADMICTCFRTVLSLIASNLSVTRILAAIRKLKQESTRFTLLIQLLVDLVQLVQLVGWFGLRRSISMIEVFQISARSNKCIPEWAPD